MLSLFFLPLFQLLLCHVILLWCDYGFMSALDKELPDLSVVDLSLGKKVFLEGLLKNCISALFLISEDSNDVLTIPLQSTCSCFPLVFHQLP